MITFSEMVFLSFCLFFIIGTFKDQNYSETWLDKIADNFTFAVFVIVVCIIGYVVINGAISFYGRFF